MVSHVLVMAKEPVPGRAKTRLCPPCTPTQAADIAAAALADTLEAVSRCGADRWVLALDGRPGPWLPPGFKVVPQVAGSFDTRLTAAWAATGGPGLQIGMDTPQVTGALLDVGLEHLLRPGCDAVLGPALDGGWWCIGLHQARPDLFTGIPMSTADTGAHQWTRLAQLGLHTTGLTPLRDIDTMADARILADEHPHLRTARAVRQVSPDPLGRVAPAVEPLTGDPVRTSATSR
jgi:uncharacterized protein